MLDADLGHGRAGAFVAGAEGHHAGEVGLEHQDDDVVHRAEVIAEAVERDIPIQSRLVGGIDLGTRRVQPRVGSHGPNFDLAHRREILVQPPTIILTKLVA